jgi:hypothetical protein
MLAESENLQEDGTFHGLALIPLDNVASLMK